MFLFWAFGLAFAIFPVHVYRFYAWFIGSSFTKRNTPRAVRNAGIVWLIVMAVVTYFEHRH